MAPTLAYDGRDRIELTSTMQDVNDATLAVFTNNSIHPLRHRSPANVAYFSVPLHLPPVASKQQQKNIERCLVAVNTACHRGQGIAEASDELIYEVTEALLQSHMPPVCYGVGQQRLSFMPSHPLAKALDDWYSHGRCCKYCLIDHNQEVTCHEVWISLRNEKLSARSESLSWSHYPNLRATKELLNSERVLPSPSRFANSNTNVRTFSKSTRLIGSQSAAPSVPIEQSSFVMQMSSVKPSSSSKPSTAGSSRPTQATANPSNGPATKKNCDSKLNRLCVTKADSTEVEFDMTAPPAWSIEAAKTTTVAEDDRFCWLDIQGERQPFWVFWTPDGTMCFHKNASAKLKEGEREECIDNAEIWHKISEDAKKLRAFQGQRRNLLNYVWQVANKRPKGGEQDEEEDHLGTGSEGHVADKKKRLAVEANVLDAEDPVAKKVKPAFE